MNTFSVNSSGRPSLRFLFSGALRSSGKYKIRGRDWLADWMIEKISGSEITHIAISDGQVVLVPTMVHAMYYPHRLYIQQEHIMYDIEMHMLQPMNIDGMERNKRLSIWSSVFSLLSRGRYQCNDCLCTSRKLLARGGIDLPRTVSTPVALLEYLVNNGCRNLRLTPARQYE